MRIADIPNWDKLSVEDQRAYLRGCFIKGDIKHATRKELEEFLVVLANTPSTDNRSLREETENFACVVRHLLQVRLGEELHRRSFWVSIVAIAISFLALLVAWWAFWRTLESSSKQSTPSALVTPLPAPKP